MATIDLMDQFSHLGEGGIRNNGTLDDEVMFQPALRTMRTDFIQVKAGDSIVYKNMSGMSSIWNILSFYTGDAQGLYVSGIAGQTTPQSGVWTAAQDGYVRLFGSFPAGDNISVTMTDLAPDVEDYLAKYNAMNYRFLPNSIPKIVAHIQEYLVDHPIADSTTLQAVIDAAFKSYMDEIQETADTYIAEAVPPALEEITAKAAEAAESAREAALSQQSAEMSEENALTYRNQAQQIKDSISAEVAASVLAAQEQATLAQESAQAADESADTAEQFVAQARAQAEAAADQAQTASGYASDAQGYMQDASGFAQNASDFADNAAQSAATFSTDPTLTIAGKAADAKATGDQLNDLKSALRYDDNGIFSNFIDFQGIKNEIPETALQDVHSGDLAILPASADGIISIQIIGTASSTYDYYLLGTQNKYLDAFDVGETYKLIANSIQTAFLFVVKKDSSNNITYYNTIGAIDEFEKNVGDTFRIFIRVMNGYNDRITLRPFIYKKNLTKTPHQLEKMISYKEDKAYSFESVDASSEIGVMHRNGTINTGVGNHLILPVSEDEVYKITGHNYNVNFPLYILLNNNTVVGYYELSAERDIVDYFLRIPDGCNKLAVNYVTKAEIKIGKDAEYSIVDYDNKYIELSYYSKAINVSNVSGNNGNHAEIRVEEGETYYISGKKWYSATPAAVCPAWLMRDAGRLVYYQGDGNFPDPEFYGDYYFTDYEITIPAGVNVLIINGNAFSGIRAKKAKAIPYEHKYKSLKQKTAVFFGTSIPQNTCFFEGNNWSIPSYACEKLLGMKCINECVGASIVARGNGDIITETDPYGWTGVSWYAVFRSLCSTLSEKNDLINNYQSKWKALLGVSDDPLYSGSKPASITQEMADYIRSCSFENRLIPYLDGTKEMPDLFVFEHGWNDSYFDAHMSAIPEDDNNLQRSSYMGSMAYLIRLIFEANPQAKIMIMSHYDNSSERGSRVFEAQKAFAEYEGLYFCDIANNIGWTQRHVTTTGYWQDGYWISSGGTERTITRKQQCIPDDLHPHLDKSGNAVKREAQILADFIKSHINLD